jgi:hypothetical protein
MQRSVGMKDFQMTSNLMKRPAHDVRPIGYVLPDGDCWACNEYKILEDWIVAAFSSEDVNNWRSFSPLEEAPDLFLKFCGLHREPDFAQAALLFAQRYGLPIGTIGEGDTGIRPDQLALQHFFEESQRAWVVLSLYESVLNRDEDAARRLLSTYRHIDDQFQGYFDALTPKRPGELAMFPPLQSALAASVSVVDTVVSESCHQGIVIAFDGPQPDPSVVRLVWSFDNLLGAMYLQMYWIMTSGGNLVRCEYEQCRRVISLARPHPEARKRRRDKRFCDDTCRQAHHRSKKRASTSDS